MKLPSNFTAAKKSVMCTFTEQQRERGTKLHQYANQFFRANGVSEYHLRVSPGNEAALSFLQKEKHGSDRFRM
ncbi:hypothetical protein [Bacillus velezensis]|uniref:hypothetical protein n=1 Tax=Bacillus velezensis TaxID=492670 RepID=UPI0020C76DDD|nr:hypothetical protein [Bacillus velezensis]